MADLEETEQRLLTKFPDVRHITRISIGDGGESVYRARVLDDGGSSRELFIREISPTRVDSLQRALALDNDIGIPSSTIFEGEPPLLVMEKANGRPLSILLPLLLLPGVWSYSSSDLTQALRSAGEYIGQLHAGTQNGFATPGSHPEFTSYLSYSTRFDDRLGDELASSVRTAISDIEDMETPVSCIFSDPTPHNVYYSAGDVEFIDFTVYYNLSVKDLIAFERGIELMVGRLPYGRDTQVETLLIPFREGYAERGLDIEFDDRYDRLKLIDYCDVLDRYLNRHLGGESSALRSKLTRYTDIDICLSRIDDIVR